MVKYNRSTLLFRHRALPNCKQMPDLSDATPSSTAATLTSPSDAPPVSTDVSKNTIQGKAVHGARILGLRTVISIILRFVSSLTLARLLTHEDYGVFGIISGIIGIGLFLCEFSLNILLIVQKDEPDADETATVFWLQQAITMFFISVVVLASSLILRLYHVEQAYIPMLCVGVAGILPATLRSVPGAMMERHLHFDPGARAEIGEQIVQIIFSISLAVAGYGAWALMISFVAARITGMLVIRAYSDWSPKGRFQWSIARQMIKKAVPFQANQVVYIAIAGLTSLVMARSIGVAAVGLVAWAFNIASAPTLMVNMLQRIAFPAMSRLQEDASEVGRVTGRTARRTVTLMGLLVSPIAIVSPFFLPLVFGEQWRPAVGLFQWNISEIVLTTALGMLAQAMLAMGFSKHRTIILGISGVARIGFLYFGILLFGVNGIAAGSYCGALVELVVLTFYVRRKIDGSETIWQDVFVPIVRLQGALLVTMLIGHYLLPHNLHPLGNTIAQLILFIILVAGPDFLSARRPIIAEVTGIWNMLRARQVASS